MDVKILDTDSRWLQQGIKGAYYIATLDQDLKRDRGSTSYLPSIIASSSHVTLDLHKAEVALLRKEGRTAGYPVGHMTRFATLLTF